MLTDYAITAVSAWCAWQLASGTQRTRSRQAWAVGFLFIGLGALLGGTSHGFAAYLGDAAMHALWKATLYTVGLSMLFALAGTIEAGVAIRAYRRALHALNLATFLYYAAWAFSHDQYVGVIFVTVGSLGLIALFQAWRWLAARDASAPWIIAGVLVSFLSAAVQQSGFSLHAHFNHNDLYHVIQIAGLYLLYRGAALLRDQEDYS